jgi:hypothetical protein
MISSPPQTRENRPQPKPLAQTPSGTTQDRIAHQEARTSVVLSAVFCHGACASTEVDRHLINNDDRSARVATSTTSRRSSTIADAILDRLFHNVHRLTLKGDSTRKIGAPRANFDAVKKT